MLSQVIGQVIQDNQDLGLSPMADIPVRTDRLKTYIDPFFNVIINNVNLIPYGLRYISKKNILYRKRKIT